MKKLIYVVKRGRKTGIYDEWKKCYEQTNKFSGALYRSFSYRTEFEKEDENKEGSLRNAFMCAEKYMSKFDIGGTKLVYQGPKKDYLEEDSWKKEGFLPFGEEIPDDAGNPQGEGENEDIDDYSDVYGKYGDTDEYNYRERRIMNLLKELENVEEIESPLKELKKQTLPLLMWGAGQSAIEVSQYLKENGVALADVFVDDNYYTDNLVFEGKPVLSYSMVKEKYGDINVILGNSSYEKKQEFEGQKSIKNLYFFFSMSYGVFEKTPKSYIQQYQQEYEDVYSILEDEESKENFLAYLKTRVSGNHKYVSECFKQEANFFHNDIFRIGKNEVYIDVGAFDGDTIRLFLQENNGDYDEIYAIEADPVNRKKLEQYIADAGVGRIHVTGNGAWNTYGKLQFCESGLQTSGLSAGEDERSSSWIDVQPVDDMFDYKKEITLLKINYFEGVREAVEGAAAILQKFAPKLVITVGFNCDNIRELPLLIKQINPDYRIYLRYNRGMVSALTLYCVV